MLRFYKLLLYTLVTAHALLVIFMALCIPLLIMLEPPYVSIPLSVWIINLATLPVRCPLTSLENKLRKKVGLPTIGGFISYYVKSLRRVIWK